MLAAGEPLEAEAEAEVVVSLLPATPATPATLAIRGLQLILPA